MGKKAWIDKKNATTYNLIYRSAEDSNDVAERIWVPADRHVGVGRPDSEAVSSSQVGEGSRYPPGHPLAWLNGKDDITEERRREIIAQGFSDDGYDYLKHLREPGKGKASLEGLQNSTEQDDSWKGPSVFVPAAQVTPPQEDWKAFDARRLTVHQPAESDDSAAQAAGGVTAFTREAEVFRGASRQEVEDLAALMKSLEDDDEAGGVEGQGEMLDDFILSATEARQAPTAETNESSLQDKALELQQRDAASSETGSSSREEEEDSETDNDESEGGRRSSKPKYQGSIASTYWRPERSDRNENLSMIDERFETLALEYEDDDIGELDEDTDAVRGHADVNTFSHVYDEFLEAHKGSQHVHESNYMYEPSAVASSNSTEKQRDNDLIAKTRARLHRLAEGHEDIVYVDEPVDQRERWDCESILSFRSNLDNHPGKILDAKGGRGARPPRAATLIRLSEKTGMPIGYIGKGAQPPLPAASAPCVVLARPKGESVDERKARKTAVKAAKREARVAKKELKGLYKEEAAKHRKFMAHPAPSTVRIP